jgi:tryptophan-rich sensory protein
MWLLLWATVAAVARAQICQQNIAAALQCNAQSRCQQFYTNSAFNSSTTFTQTTRAYCDYEWQRCATSQPSVAAECTDNADCYSRVPIVVENGAPPPVVFVTQCIVDLSGLPYPEIPGIFVPDGTCGLGTLDASTVQVYADFPSANFTTYLYNCSISDLSQAFNCSCSIPACPQQFAEQIDLAQQCAVSESPTTCLLPFAVYNGDNGLSFGLPSCTVDAPAPFCQPTTLLNYTVYAHTQANELCYASFEVYEIGNGDVENCTLGAVDPVTLLCNASTPAALVEYDTNVPIPPFSCSCRVALPTTAAGCAANATGVGLAVLACTSDAYCESTFATPLGAQPPDALSCAPASLACVASQFSGSLWSPSYASPNAGRPCIVDVSAYYYQSIAPPLGAELVLDFSPDTCLLGVVGSTRSPVVNDSTLLLCLPPALAADPDAAVTQQAFAPALYQCSQCIDLPQTCPPPLANALLSCASNCTCAARFPQAAYAMPRCDGGDVAYNGNYCQHDTCTFHSAQPRASPVGYNFSAADAGSTCVDDILALTWLASALQQFSSELWFIGRVGTTPLFDDGHTYRCLNVTPIALGSPYVFAGQCQSTQQPPAGGDFPCPLCPSAASHDCIAQRSVWLGLFFIAAFVVAASFLLASLPMLFCAPHQRSMRASAELAYRGWYAPLPPPLQPPAWAFGAAWSVVYTTRTFALWIVLINAHCARGAATAGLVVFGVGTLIVEPLWAVAFVGARSIALGAVAVAAALVLAGVTCGLFSEVNVAAALLYLPGVLWLAYASAIGAALALRGPLTAKRQ